MCRTTVTFYTFDVDKDGQRLYFDSKRQDEVSQRCEQLYPKHESWALPG